MELEVLISTMNINSNRENQKLIKKMNIEGKSLTISQTNKKGKEGVKNRVIYDNTRGLSKSRNLGINNADSDIILLADDDVIYVPNYNEIIKKEYEKNPDADMIAFYVKSKNPERKVRKLRSGKIGWIRIFRVSSFQLTFKLDSIKNNELKFDENMGAGTENYCGEETIFLSECLRKKMKLLYVDEKIGEVEQKNSTWYQQWGREYLAVEKKCFQRIAPKWWWLLWIQFLIRKGAKVYIKKWIKSVVTQNY